MDNDALPQEQKGNLLRPHQVQEMRSEHQTLQAKLKHPDIQDKGSIVRQIRSLERSLNTDAPRAPDSVTEEARLVKREAELRTQWLDGMPSQEEMRKNPPGAVDKHRAWEKRHKKKLTEWKNIRLRLNVGSEDRDVANHERYRPTLNTLLMDNAQIQGKQFYFPQGDIPIRNVMSDADKARLVEINARQEATESLGLTVPATKKRRGGRPKKAKAPEAQAA